MTELTKRKTEHGYSFTITTEEGSFEIYFSGNLDLYWRYVYEGSILDNPQYVTFRISKEIYYLFLLFKELYSDIKNCDIFKYNEATHFPFRSFKELNKELEENKKRNQEVQKSQEYNKERLFKDGVIEWHCDDYDYDEGGVVRIEEQEDEFLVTIERSKVENPFYTYAVRFRNSGSRYPYFNIPFMRMYNKLITSELDNPQISIEEYLYTKKLEKKPN